MQKLNVYGDSHARFFGLVPDLARLKHRRLAEFEVDVQLFIGSTVLGLPRRKTTLSVNLSISDTIENSIAVMNFGQVDIELGYYYRRVVKGEDVSFEEFGRRLGEAYTTFLTSIGDRAKMIFVKGVNPPVLVPQKKAVKYIARIISEKQDTSVHDEQLELLRTMLPPIAERTAMSQQYNQMLERMCQELGFGYFDLWDLLMDKRTKLVHERFIPARRNHHLVDSVWVRRQHWKKLLEQIAEHQEERR